MFFLIISHISVIYILLSVTTTDTLTFYLQYHIVDLISAAYFCAESSNIGKEILLFLCNILIANFRDWDINDR